MNPPTNSDGETDRVEVTEISDDLLSETTQLSDADGDLLQTTTTEYTDSKDGGGGYTTTTTLSNGTVLITQVNGDGDWAGTITETPRTDGGVDRTVEMMVDGNVVVVTQHADWPSLALDSDRDGDPTNDRGDFVTTGLTINGEQPVESQMLVAALDALPGAVGAGNVAWYDSTDARYLGGTLTCTQSLLAAWKQGDVPGVFAAGASTLIYGAPPTPTCRATAA